MWLSHHGTPSTAQGNSSKGFAGPCLPPGFRGAIIQAWSLVDPPWDLSSHSQFYVFFIYQPPQGGPGPFCTQQ